jgi:hypothetical protein
VKSCRCENGAVFPIRLRTRMIRINMFPASLTGLGRDGWGDDFQ